MTTQVVTLLIAILLLLAPLWLMLARALRRRWRLRHGPRRLDPDAQLLLHTRSHLYRRLPPDLRPSVENRTLELFEALRFIGCGGLVVTEAMRLLIAFHASLLFTRVGSDVVSELSGVLIYPDSFLAPRSHIDHAGVVSEGHEALAGEAQSTARVVFSWADIEAGIARDDGYNVLLHEFAHFLDHALDSTLSSPSPAAKWHDLLEREYAALCRAVDAGEDTLIDPYGSEAPAEFFAVATETFFELGAALEARHPELYRALARIYALDPARWS